MSIISESEVTEFRDIIEGNEHDAIEEEEEMNDFSFSDEYYDNELRVHNDDGDFVENDQIGECDSNDYSVSTPRSKSYRIIGICILLGVLLIVSIIIYTITYLQHGTLELTRKPSFKPPTNSFKIPGIEELTMNADPDSKITVWCLRLTKPPMAVIADYSAYFNAPRRNEEDFLQEL